ncbi:MAG: transcription elongation factor Spt5 [Candidatus Thermoplasmatota archaeon]|nr:transcription elongation factor Spt5 [Candidatus Thermoplasmatota archaeon]
MLFDDEKDKGHGGDVPGGFFDEKPKKEPEEFLTSKEDAAEPEYTKKVTPEATAPAPAAPTRIQPVQLFVMKTGIGRELDVVNAIYLRLRKIKAQVFAVFAPNEIRGYIFIEAREKNEIKKATSGVTHARSMLKETVPYEQIASFLVPTSAVIRIREGDIVEIIAGPFKGERARIKSIDERKEEVTVELVEAMIPIPVTLKGEQVRTIEKK